MVSRGQGGRKCSVTSRLTVKMNKICQRTFVHFSTSDPSPTLNAYRILDAVWASCTPMPGHFAAVTLTVLGWTSREGGRGPGARSDQPFRKSVKNVV